MNDELGPWTAAREIDPEINASWVTAAVEYRSAISSAIEARRS
ncbi:hypothetical protein [Streptomyces chartreusis]|nr:hypothetical protein [Streptomyces chartreusis]